MQAEGSVAQDPAHPPVQTGAVLQFPVTQHKASTGSAGDAVTAVNAAHVPPFSRKPSSTFAVILSTIAACLVSGGITYLATNPDDPEPLVPVATAAPTHTPLDAAGEARTVSLADSEPIQFPNPFDATEIFSFPPGTTPLEMREAVSKILLERARERGFGSHGARPGG